MRILVTGGTGSIGLPLALALHAEGHEVTVIARSEYGHYLIRRQAPGIKCVMLDIRHPDTLEYAAGSDLVYNCAALKHVGFCEEQPNMAYAVNTRAAEEIAKVAPQMIQLSTDKAAGPQTVLGHSKAEAERRILAASPQHRCIRLCNVLLSRGSLLETAAWQMAQGLPVTVTDLEATRYYITAGQAVGALLAARELPLGSLIAIEGEQVSVGDLLAAYGCKDAEIKVIGLQHGEKLHEAILTEKEEMRSERFYIPQAEAWAYILNRATSLPISAKLAMPEEPEPTIGPDGSSLLAAGTEGLVPSGAAKSIALEMGLLVDSAEEPTPHESGQGAAAPGGLAQYESESQRWLASDPQSGWSRQDEALLAEQTPPSA